MHTIFSSEIHSNYGQAYVHLQDTFDVTSPFRKGQTSGLLGTAVPTLLYLTFGIHTGYVHLTVNVADQEPPIAPCWEEVVEAPFLMPTNAVLGLADWNGSIWIPIPLCAAAYRVRYSAMNFGMGEEHGARDENGEVRERYELTFWPSPVRADEVVKVTSSNAAYWHQVAQGKTR